MVEVKGLIEIVCVDTEEVYRADALIENKAVAYLGEIGGGMEQARADQALGLDGGFGLPLLQAVGDGILDAVVQRTLHVEVEPIEVVEPREIEKSR
ncbi:hypothetical protein C2W62_23780 [Candidatus Entotheonella serta]|nr:hypothetical protein C2W62_23780 [Candidatus Entotheonella serta]